VRVLLFISLRVRMLNADVWHFLCQRILHICFRDDGYDEGVVPYDCSCIQVGSYRSGVLWCVLN